MLSYVKIRRFARLDCIYPMDMKRENLQRDGNIVLKITGDIDECSVKTIRADIDEIIDTSARIRSLTLDMSGVTFVDSTGLGFVFGRYKKLKALGAELLLCNVPRQVDKVFQTSGVYRIIPVVE